MSFRYAVFILTHGRPDYQLTLQTLQNRGYTGDYYLVVDDQDSTLPEYLANYGDSVIVFDKDAYVSVTDTGLYTPQKNFAVFSRNAIEDIARDLGYDCFIMMDDDLTNFRFRYPEDNSFKSLKITQNLDKIFEAYIEYLMECDLACLCFGIHNNYMKGTDVLYEENPRLRLCFTVYFRNCKFPVSWKLNMCEDRITSLECSRSGQVWLQLLNVQVDTVEIGGKIKGGNSEVYNSVDKFKQTFFPVMIFPDCNYCSYWKDHWITSLHLSNICPKIVGGIYKK